MNFERTIGWSGHCFDMVDEKLDLIVTPNRGLRWKDEDELEHAAALGLVDAEAVRAEAERVVETWPFPTGWEEFEPDPRVADTALPARLGAGLVVRQAFAMTLYRTATARA